MTRLLVIPDEFPLPVNSGGRVDTWRRLQALQQAGVDLAVLTWFDVHRQGPPTDAAMLQAQAVCPQWHLSPITRGPLEVLRRLLHLGRLPSHAAARWVTLDHVAVLAWAKVFDPDVILLDRLYGVAAARWLSQQLQVPWLYRSHNREADYMLGQGRRAQGAKARLGLWANQVGLAGLERRTLQDAAVVLDISASDAAHWQQLGVDHAQWLPPVADAVLADALAACGAPTDWDVMYFGNLNTPNNLEALGWFIEQVLPRLSTPGLRVAVVGSRPAPLAHQLVGRDARITLVADPPAMAPLMAAARVLVNPMRSGSGVNLKSVDMLCSRAHLVSTRVGVAGMPPQAVACFAVHDQPDGFAQAVADALLRAAPDAAALHARRQARQAFDAADVAAAVLAACAKAISGGADGRQAQHG
ncbi:MAG: glycosyltransferase [Rubrivivax sp.]|nr:glycosyltransferase [Rubrivivax sp.]